ncbi:MAG: VTT domain-containing protein [Pseudomonadota bacterium]
MNYRVILRGLAVIASLALLGYLVKTTQLASLLDEQWIDREVRGQGLSGDLLFLAIGGLATAIGVPRQVIAFLGGYAYGIWTGTLLATLAAGLGCVLAFYYARLLGRSLISARYSGRIRKLDDFVQNNPFSMTLLIRLLPVGSNLVTNLVAGVSRVRSLPFFTASLLGYLPQSLVFALVGGGVQVDSAWHIVLGVTLFIVAGILGAQLYHRFRHGKSFDEQVDAKLGEAPAEKG